MNKLINARKILVANLPRYEKAKLQKKPHVKFTHIWEAILCMHLYPKYKL